MKSNGILFIISAPSGSGKTTLISKLVDSIGGIGRSISMTTRSPRAGEIDGVDYIFIGKGEFLKRKKNGEFLEWAKVFDEYYGTPKKYIKHLVAKGQDVVLNIDVQGAMKIKRLKMKTVFIFILPPSIELLKERLVGRSTESKKVINERLKFVKKEMAYLSRYDYAVVNNKIEAALGHLRSIVIAERCKIRRG